MKFSLINIALSLPAVALAAPAPGLAYDLSCVTDVSDQSNHPQMHSRTDAERF